MTRIAIVGMACRYPDAASPRELWENTVAGRRAFRRLPDVRMNLADYWDADPAVPDRFYARTAAVLEGYNFDRISYKVAGSTYRSTDLTHWLALDTAAAALADAGFPMGEGLPNERTGVIVGNTLTGEFARANQMRLRWPYVRRVLVATLRQQQWNDEQIAAFVDNVEETYKAPFPLVDEDTLAGALSNTIAGRICNHFDLKGGGYTVDGACSSSLLSVVTACKALLDLDIDVAIAGGVDLSIDPFEIIGFAKTGALATGEMRVYDRTSNGFWPGEGCGMAVLMREADAVDAGHRIYASIAGWGVSSDGRGGITRPEITGYQLALRRAYERTGFGIDTVGFFEGHGTGTKVGDTTELAALSRAREAANPQAPPAAIGSIKGMIGHTKAAAGVAGLIKASMAVHHQILPPSVGSVEPHELLSTEAPRLRTLRKAEPWPESIPVRAGVTAMGFGGINTHIVLENPRPQRRSMDYRHRILALSPQDAELLAVDATTQHELTARLRELADFVSTISFGQLSDLASSLHAQLRDRPLRAAVIASSPEDAERLLRQAVEAVEAGETKLIRPDGRFLLGHVTGPARVGFLFPGQGSGRGVSGGALRRRFAEADEVYTQANLPAGGDVVATEVAQPRIVTGAVAGQRVLTTLGIEASVAVGHSLGEIVALHWAGSIDQATLLRIAAVRGQTMARHAASGTMASISASPQELTELLANFPVVVAAYNGPQHTVLAGSVQDITAVCDQARAAGLTATVLSVSHAFHSPLVAPAADTFATALQSETFRPLHRRVVSTVTGEALRTDTDIQDLLRRQITDPVLFSQALAMAAKSVDLFIEVGPGRVLTGLAATTVDVPAVALDTDSESLVGVLRAAAAAYVVGAAPVESTLFTGRLIRALEVGAKFSFLSSPCEAAPELTLPASPATKKVRAATPTLDGAHVVGEPAAESAEELMRRLTAERAELPLELVKLDSRLLDDLHLSSITVGQVVNQMAQQLGVPPAALPTNFATATVGELAETLETLAETSRDGDASTAAVTGVSQWARAWRVDLDELPLIPGEPEPNGTWEVYAPPSHPFAAGLNEALRLGHVGDGVLVCLPQPCPPEALEYALRGAKRALSRGGDIRYVLVDDGLGAAGIAKTLHLEAPQIRVTIVHCPDTADALTRVLAEVSATTRFSEVFYDEAGHRRVPTLRAMTTEVNTPQGHALGGQDVLLVTGGGKGITAECALAIASDSGAKLAIIGRSDPQHDGELAANLARLSAGGVALGYARADVTNADEVRSAVQQLTDELGTITGILHGAGRNEPTPLTSLETSAIVQTFAPKVDGLRNILDAVDTEEIRLLVTLGSIIGRAGLRGEAHYATANDWLAERTLEFGHAHPGCRTLCLEWSVWSGVGMGERLSVVESLARDGVTPISPQQGVAILRRLLADADTPSVVVISGRTEGVHTVRYDLPDLPLLRFLERPLIRYHKCELVAEVELSPSTDLYLTDHLLDGNLLFPAVFGLEAMAQVASAVTADDGTPVVERAAFLRPIIVPPHGRTRIRIAAVVNDDKTIDVAIRSEETSFAADHFTARLKLERFITPSGPPLPVPAGLPLVPLNPADDLYGDLLFQSGRFERLRAYHRGAARDVEAVVESVANVRWFASFLPDRLLLGDPGVRDAMMHGNQVCVPHATLLPEGVDRIYPAGAAIEEGSCLRYCATETSRDGDTYVYDLVLRDERGRDIERWEGLRLRAVRKQDGTGPWVPALLGPYLERSIGELIDAQVAVNVEPAAEPVVPDVDALHHRRAQTAVAVDRTLGHHVELTYRPDGMPEINAGPRVSVSHGAGLTTVAAAEGHIGCDVEAVTHRDPQVWDDLLGAHTQLARLISAEVGEGTDLAATRVWTAMECLQKAGKQVRSPLVLLPCDRPGWTMFNAGDARVLTFATNVRGVGTQVVFSILAEGGRR
ncbi:type I polyketide synthase [Micromonospora sediminicola]|uniref:type I polyketide synthase n=1 Tax=Micromonospora sediminicola TaxID=946078 RepID=UPI0033EAD6A3